MEIDVTLPRVQYDAYFSLDTHLGNSQALVILLPSCIVPTATSKRVLRMVKLRQNSAANYTARKRLPHDVQEEYGRLHGARHEAKFSAPASIGVDAAKQKFRGLGVPSSNLGAPTNILSKALKRRINLKSLAIYNSARYTSRYTNVCCEWSSSGRTALLITPPASAFLTTYKRNMAAYTVPAMKRNSLHQQASV